MIISGPVGTIFAFAEHSALVARVVTFAVFLQTFGLLAFAAFLHFRQLDAQSEPVLDCGFFLLEGFWVAG